MPPYLITGIAGKLSLFPCKRFVVLAKKTIKNQITLHKAVVTRFTGVEYFDVSTDGECIVLRPLQKSRADETRAKLAELRVGGEDVTAAVFWARKTP